MQLFFVKNSIPKKFGCNFWKFWKKFSQKFKKSQILNTISTSSSPKKSNFHISISTRCIFPWFFCFSRILIPSWNVTHLNLHKKCSSNKKFFKFHTIGCGDVHLMKRCRRRFFETDVSCCSDNGEGLEIAGVTLITDVTLTTEFPGASDQNRENSFSSEIHNAAYHPFFDQQFLFLFLFLFFSLLIDVVENQSI